MKIDYIVSRIEASQDGTPDVYVTYSNPNDFKAGADRTPQNQFGPNMMAFTSPEDLMTCHGWLYSIARHSTSFWRLLPVSLVLFWPF